MFVLNATDLLCASSRNSFLKYADDLTLVVPASNSSSIPLELENIRRWCIDNNQSLNIGKCAELICYSARMRPPSASSVAYHPRLLALPELISLVFWGC